MRLSRKILFLAALAFTLLTLLSTRGQAADGSFRPIFNGRDLTGWDGKSGLWSVQDDGVLQGSSHGLTLANSFLIWRGGKLRDFHLKLRFRLLNGNSGVQYRSRELGPWTVSGYQAEIANETGKTGFLYEERGRKFLAYVGQSVRIPAHGSNLLTGLLGTKSEYLRWGYYAPAEWNSYDIVGVGPYVAHYVNGYKTVELYDEDPTHAVREGVLALQIHAGAPMTVQFKDIVLKNL